MNLYIVIKTTFSAVHHWPECPHEDVYYLRAPHRHLFYVTMKWKVDHDNRDKEFITMKKSVDKFLKDNWEGRFLGRKSCEMMGKKLLDLFDADFVSVFEDNENGAEVYR